MIQSFAAQLTSKNAYDLGNEIASTSGVLKELYADRTPEGISRYENIQELLNGLKEFTETENELEEDVTPRGLPEFLQDVALLTNADNEKEEDKNKVTLMTIHSAKGLEFPYVNIVGLEENLFPSQLSLTSRVELEEERRLFYVAVTRAEKELHLSFSTSRYKWGNLMFCEPSRFIEEIDEKYLEYTFNKNSLVKEETPEFSGGLNFNSGFNQKPKKSKMPPKRNAPPKPVHTTPKNLKKINTNVIDTSANTLNLSEGMMVNHQKFGNGIIESLDNGKATINFQNIGNKQLLLKFAKLTIVK
jgi:DNA helicase-2/ATP-dependent DNA helicase PcrA